MNPLLRLFAPAVAALALAASPAVAQQATGTVTGTVTDSASSRPVSDAQVVITGTQLGARTDADGHYRIGAAPAGAQSVRVIRIGYQSAARPVAVPAGGSVTIDFRLAIAPTLLAQVTINAAGTAETRRENGASVDHVKNDSIEKAAVPNMSELIAGRSAGVSVQQSSGTTGTGARIRIRGANSVSLSNEPLLVIDGVRIDNEVESNSIGVGGQSPSRINDINPEDIESFDVIKGPAASALYGTAAANGVIQITTKHGTAGKPKWNVFGELGSVVENNDYPPNYGGWTTPGLYDLPGLPSQAGVASPTCTLYFDYLGYCTVDSLSAFNPIMSGHPFRTGRRQKVGASVSGGNQVATYFLSGQDDKEAGVYHTSNLDRLNLRANIFAKPTSKLDIDVKTNFLRNNLQLPQNDNNYYGVIAAGLTGWQNPGLTQGYNPIPPSQFENIDTRQRLDRFIGSAVANWRPLGWLSGNGTLGIDVGNRFDAETLQPNKVFFSDASLGYRQSNRTETVNITSNYTLTGKYAPTDELQTTTSVGYQYVQNQLQATYGFGNTLVAGSGTLNGVTDNRAVGEGYIDNKTAGGFVSEQVAWRDKLFVTGTVRGDKNSAFGANFKFITYPAISASYVAYEGGSRLSQLRIRSAYGVSGLRPGILDASQYFIPVTARVNGASAPAITIGNLQNPNLKPERTGEYEAGFDATIYNDLANFQFTYYNKQSRDALISVPLAPSLGGPGSIFKNIGSTSNSGLELTINTTPLRSENATLGLTFTGSTNRNRLKSLGGQPSFAIGSLNSSQRMVEGYPLGGYWGTTVTRATPDADGRLNPDSVIFSTDTADLRFLGSPIPTRLGSLSGDLNLFKIFRITTLFDYHGGNKLFNATEQFRCLGFVLTCRGLNDQSAPLKERANAFATATDGSFYGGYIEDASFVKWRELAITVNTPARLAASLRASSASITLAGRNLHTWTKYSGLDPEVNFDGQANFSTADFLTQPQVRYYTARINLTY